MLYIIDGYNLLFIMYPETKNRTKGGSLESARLRILNLLSNSLPNDSILIVFDAKNHSPPAKSLHNPEYDQFVNIKVVFSHEEIADDFITTTLKAYSNYKAITVISSDHRVQKGSKARGCPFMETEQFIDILLGFKTPPSEKGDSLVNSTKKSDEEIQMELAAEKEIFESSEEKDSLLVVFSQKPKRKRN